MYEIIYDGVNPNDVNDEIIEKTITKCFEKEQLKEANLEVTITITTPEKIRVINNEYRQVDKSTDVLSFPMFEREELDEKISRQEFLIEDILRRYYYFRRTGENTSCRIWS